VPTEIHRHWWWISRHSGNLLRSQSRPVFRGAMDYPRHLHSALEICANPYECTWSPNPAEVKGYISDKMLSSIYRRLVWLGNSQFALSVLYSTFSAPLFDTTREAFSAISRVDNDRNNRCLQRCLLAVKTSSSFKCGGVLFIGSMIETREMHAWIIENGAQPDHEDRSWINHRPLLAYTFC